MQEILEWNAFIDNICYKSELEKAVGILKLNGIKQKQINNKIEINETN